MTEKTTDPAASSLRAWLELVRLPNLFTVPGDPIAGFLLAGAALHAEINLWNVLPCAVAALFLYMAGLVTNDLFDLEEDRRERPGRPLPSGRVSRRSARAAAVVLFGLGIGSAALAGIATLWLAGLLTAAIVVYNSALKRVPVVGPLLMGLCRGASLLMGAAAFGAPALAAPPVLLAAAGLTLYVMSVTVMAAKETSGRAPGWIALAPCLVILLWLPALGVFAHGGRTKAQAVGQALSVVTAVLVGMRGIDVRRQTDPRRVSQAVGAFLRALLAVQACMAVMVVQPGPWAVMVVQPGLWVALALLAAWPVATWVGRRFYSS
jgi:4-hydroxybenzoate polyprenyltransferase